MYHWQTVLTYIYTVKLNIEEYSLVLRHPSFTCLSADNNVYEKNTMVKRTQFTKKAVLAYSQNIKILLLKTFLYNAN